MSSSRSNCSCSVIGSVWSTLKGPQQLEWTVEVKHRDHPYSLDLGGMHYEVKDAASHAGEVLDDLRALA